MQKKVFEKIRAVVKEIPHSKVLSYGDVANLAGIKDARIVGWALHGNQNPKIPCHRVVQKDGGLAKNYSLGTWTEQKRRLEVEGVTFIDRQQIDMDKHHWDFSEGK